MTHPREIPSAVWDREADRLTELAAGQIVLEVGADFGFSTVVLARVATIVHSVDWFKGDSMAGERDTLMQYRMNLQRHGIIDKVVTHIGDAALVVPMFPEHLFGLAFVDAFHDEPSVFADASRVLPKVASGGYIAFHDYGRFEVAPAVNRFAEKLGVDICDIDVVDHLAVIQTP